MYRFLEIDPERNMLLCSADLVGRGEIVEIYRPGPSTPSQVLSNVLVKLDDADSFMVKTAFNGHEAIGKVFNLGEKCVLRILRRTIGGTRKRRHATIEKLAVDMEKDEHYRERKVNRAKTGSVRKKRKRSK